MMMRLAEAVRYMHDSQCVGDDRVACERIVTDSRAVRAGDLFVALKGERFDAHDFLPDVVRQGAAAVVVERLPQDLAVPAALVPDTRIALGELAAGWRRRFVLPVVAVTGSNGKTTVKEMISTIFARAVGESHRLATAGNFNNDIGVPLTLFGLNAQHRLAVLELGMNHPGETAYLAAIAQPTIALINNAQREHQEFMVDVAAVAQEHLSVVLALPADGTAVFPADSEFAPLWRAAAAQRRIFDFALDAPAVVSGRYDAATRALRATTPAGDIALNLPVLGEHNARNALAAMACALAAGVTPDAIAYALSRFGAVKGRLQVTTLTRGALAGTTLVDDTYNANPDSVRAAIDVLAAMPGPRALILGDMGEVGDQGPEFHREAGAYAHARGIEVLLATGDLARHACEAFGAGAHHFADVGALNAHVQSAVRPLASVLVKGSRFMRMERVVGALENSYGAIEQQRNS